MGYNVLSGSTSVTHQISVSGSFIGDGALLENVEQFPLQNAVVTRIPFYKTIGGELGLNASENFTYNANTDALTIGQLTSSVSIRIANPVSGSLAGSGSYLGLDANGNIVVTSSLGTGGGGGNVSYSRRAITATATASTGDTLIGVSASAALDIRLPSASGYLNGQYFIVKDEAGNANIFNITIKTSGSETIDGESAIVLESPFVSISLYSNGVDKFFIY